MNLARTCQDRSLHVGISLIDRRNPGVHLRFWHHRHLERARRDVLDRNSGAQSRNAFGFEERLKFVRRAGKQHQKPLLAVILSANPLSGRGAERIRQRRGASQNVGLLGIIGGHLHAALGEALFKSRDHVRIALQFQPQRIGHRFARQVIFRGAKAARENDNVRTPHREFGGRSQSFAVVAHNALEAHFNAQFIQLFGEIERVGVLAMGSKQLRPDGNDLGVHG